MKMFLIAVLLLFAGVLGFAWYIGVFFSMNLEEKQEGGFKVVGLEFTGPYSEVGKSMTEIDEKLKGMGVTSTRGFGIYYDDPKTTSSEKCRSFIGNILEEKDYDKIAELKSAGFRIDSISTAMSVVTAFPLRSSLSYMIGPMKAYPAFSKYMAGKNYKTTLSLEVYDMHAKQILFIMQYEKIKK